MTGEEILILTRRLVGDQTINEYTEINRALRKYCRITNFQWLREVIDAPFNLETDVADYPLPELGFRRIERIFVESPTTGAWEPISEADELAFRELVAEGTNADGSIVGGTPGHFFIHGNNISFTPTPDEGVSLKVTGTLNSPTVTRTGELPGPSEYHDLVAELAAGFHLQRSKDDNVYARGERKEAKALFEMRTFALRDSQPNRINSLKIEKQSITR